MRAFFLFLLCALSVLACDLIQTAKTPKPPAVPEVRIVLNETDQVIMDGAPAEPSDIEERVYELVGGGDHRVLMINSRKAYYENYKRVMDAVRRGYDRHRADFLGLTLDAYYALDMRSADSLDVQRSRAAFPIRVKELVEDETPFGEER